MLGPGPVGTISELLKIPHLHLWFLGQVALAQTPATPPRDKTPTQSSASRDRGEG